MKKLVIPILGVIILLGMISVLSANSKEPVIDDKFLHKYLPEYSGATIFRMDYLDFFNPSEKQMAEQNHVKFDYVIQGDFNKNGKTEVLISGLISKKPINNKYIAFILLLEKDKSTYKRLLFQKFEKPLDENMSGISNLYFNLDKGKVNIIFASNSGEFGWLEWNRQKYQITFNEE